MRVTVSKALRRIRRSYPLKLVVVFSLVGVVITGIGIGVYLQTDTILTSQTNTELESAARIEAQSLDDWYDGKRVQTKTAARGAPLYSDDDSEIIAYLWSVVEDEDDFEAAYFVDTDQQSVITSVGSTRIISSSEVIRPGGQRNFARRLNGTGHVRVSEPFRAYEGGAPVVLISAIVPERDNRSLVMVVNLNRLSSSEPHELDKAQFQVLDSEGQVIMADSSREILEQNVFKTEPRGDHGVLETRHGNETTVVGYASMQSRNWTVLAWMPMSEAYAISSVITNGLGFMLVAFLLGFGGIAYFLTQLTVHPVRELAAKAQILQEGTLDEPIETSRTDEFGDLFAAFEEMRGSLRSQMVEVEQARQESEQLTEDLQREAEEFATVMAACADGELDRRLEPSTDHTSMQKIATAFNEMMDDVERQTEELEAFSSIISHDLRNPLNVAAGRMNLLAREMDSEHISPVIEALDRMEQIIEDGLTLARGTEPDEITTVEVADRAKTAWSHVEQQDGELTLDDNVSIEADPNLLEQLLENLFRNAVEHGGNDVTIFVGGYENGFYVEDTGQGLPSDRVNQVFEPGVSDGTGGTGLGLTIVKRIAAAHGWDIEATNGEHGARFECHIPSDTVVFDDREKETPFIR